MSTATNIIGMWEVTYVQFVFSKAYATSTHVLLGHLRLDVEAYVIIQDETKMCVSESMLELFGPTTQFYGFLLIYIETAKYDYYNLPAKNTFKSHEPTK